ncbi:MAG: hypothetical protein IJS14_11770 [Lentisphaeria bacterium]|nr:hypothetical protein [Lentisphaeria bacterium]
MKKILFLMAASMLVGTTMADEQSDAELQLEKEAEAFEKSTAFTDPKAIEALRQRRESVKAARYQNYQKAMEKNGGRTLEAMNPPECKYYSTEGVCSLLNTRISPYPKIAHVNTVLNFRFPKKLGSSTAQYISVYPRKESGYDLKYIDDAANIVADIYVYDMPKTDSPVSVFNNNAILNDEIKRVVWEISQLHPKARFDEEITHACFKDDSKTRFVCFGAEYDSASFDKHNKIEKCYSFALLFAKKTEVLQNSFHQARRRSAEFRKIT